MRHLIAATVLLMLAGCLSSPPPQPSLVNQCSDPRPQVCTMEYNPVCANLVAGGTKEYPSGCNACADEAVSGFLKGSCPE